MNKVNQIWTLLQNELRLEWRGKAAINSILLYVVVVTYVLHTGISYVDASLWNALFWIVVTFSSVNALAKSFIGESEAKRLYYYSLVGPQVFYIAKAVYNFLLLLVLALLSFVGLVLFVGEVEIQSSLYWLCILLGSFGFSLIMTMVSAIAAKGNSAGNLMSILSFPVLIPTLMFLMDLSIKGMFGATISQELNDVMLLTMLNVLIFSVSMVLFPYLWRD